jgi:hypothetical protein
MALIKANRWSNTTNIRLEEGESYRFYSSGMWTDGGTPPCTAAGYSSPKLERWERLRREPQAKWFSIIGRVENRKETQFDIGNLLERRASYKAVTSGVLYCFANDVWFMYWNNSGAVDLQIEKL